MLINTDRKMQDAIEADCFPGAVLLVAKKKEIIHFEAYGMANRFDRTPMTVKTVFDLASLTKPLATTLALMVLVQERVLSLDMPLKKVISRLDGTNKAEISIKFLLTHQSGLPAWRPYFRQLIKYVPENRPALLKKMLTEEPLHDRPGNSAIYSDLGFMVLAWIIENVTGMAMARYVTQTVYRPLGLDSSFYFPSLAGSNKEVSCAATELCQWRALLLNGQVHDDNAYTTAALQGHAGLFADVKTIFLLLSHILDSYHHNSDSPLSSKVVRWFLNPEPADYSPLGFDVPSGESPACGRYFSDNTVGHLGFTGTSFWMDVSRQVIVILCSNRIHPNRFNNRIRRWRPIIHDTIMEELKHIKP